jgi:hypothetical protein
MKRTARPHDLDQTTFMPFEVRYAMEYKGGRLGKKEIKDLISRGFVDESFYLLTKATAGDPALQSTMVYETVANTVRQGDANKEEDLGNLLTSYVDLLPTNMTVKGSKMVALSQWGFSEWQKQFRLAAEGYAEGEAEPFLVGTSMFLALRKFVEAYSGSGSGRFNVLMPAWIEDPADDNCGYRLSFDGQAVDFSLLPRTFERSPNHVIIDDILRTGNKMNSMRRFWESDPSANSAEFNFYVFRYMADSI